MRDSLGIQALGGGVVGRGGLLVAWCRHLLLSQALCLICCYHRHCVYSGRYGKLKEDHPTVQYVPYTRSLSHQPQHFLNRMFWTIVEEDFTEEQRTKLLQFSTGSASLPVEGFAGLQSKAGARHPFHITHADPVACPLPRAHTCFNKIDLPMMDEYLDLRDALELVIELECGFGLGE